MKEVTHMSDRLRRALIRFAKAAAAAAIAAAITELPVLGEALPEAAWAVPILAAILMAVEKYLSYEPEP
jgi:hypothetical protein